MNRRDFLRVFAATTAGLVIPLPQVDEVVAGESGVLTLDALENIVKVLDDGNVPKFLIAHIKILTNNPKKFGVQRRSETIRYELDPKLWVVKDDVAYFDGAIQFHLDDTAMLEWFSIENASGKEFCKWGCYSDLMQQGNTVNVDSMKVFLVA